MKNQTKRSIVFLFTIIFMMGVSINLNPKSINLNYIVKNEDTSLKSSDNKININTPDNITYTEPMSGYYPATYGFENCLQGELPTDWWYWTHDGSGYYQITSELNGHKNVLEMRKIGGSTKVEARNDFLVNVTSGTVEFWLYKDTENSNDATRLFLMDNSGNTALTFFIEYKDLFEGTWGDRTLLGNNVFERNNWHYIKVDFDISQGGWQLEVDNILYGTGYTFAFENPVSEISEFRMASIYSGDYPNYGAYIDALSYSWDSNYDIGDNLNEGLLLSYDNSTNLEWQGYSLDGQSNKTIYGNTTIPMPNYGQHRIQVFGNDSVGINYQSDLRYFSVGSSSVNFDEWQYFREINLNPSTPESDYQVKIKLNSTNFDYDHLNSNGSDIRFYDEFHNPLNYWVETWNYGGDSLIWVKIPSMGTSTFLMCYGNSFAPSESNGEGVFLLYDDFEGTSLNPAKWTSEGDAYSFISVSGGVVRIYSDCPSTYWPGLTLGFHDYWKDHGETYSWHSITGGATFEPSEDIWLTGEMHWINSTSGPYYENDVFYSEDINNPDGPLSVRLTTDTTYYGPGTGWGSWITSVDDTLGQPGRALRLRLWSDRTGIADLRVDWVAVLKYSELNPDISIGLENEFGLEITINTPLANSLYGTVAPDFNITIDDPDYDFTWYSLDGGSTNIYSNETIGKIDQTEWDKIGNGTATIVFYANDTANNIGQAEVTVRKDILAPLIVINSPSENQVCGVDAPTFDLSIFEHEVNSTWYTLDYGSVNISFSGSTGTLDPTEWAKKGGGIILIRFYANDSFGQESFTDVTIIKDITLPLITINSPGVEEIFGDSPPDYDISITELNLDFFWYTLDGGAINISISNFTGIIDQTEWNKQGNGTVTVIFFARDEGGNEGFAEIIVRKEIIAPTITINSPLLNEIYSISSPSYSITINDSNLDSYWYSLDGGAINISISSFTGNIDQTEWNKHGNGTITILFFANDTLGNENYQDVIIRKDVSAPIITINSPSLNDIFGHNPPNYSISVIDSQLDSMWYTIDNGLINITITNKAGTINQTEWEKNLGGTVLIKFYANDTLGNTRYSEVAIIKNVLYGIDYIELFTPSTYSQVLSNLIDFSWSSLDIGVNFTLQISNISDFSHIVFQSENIPETPTVTNFSVPLSIIQGQYYWRVRSTYGNYNGSWSDYFSFTLHINEYAPNLVLNDFTPTTGVKETIFRFTVIYSDLDNNAPEYVEILINENSYFMEKLHPSDIDFTDGCIYQFITLLTPSTTTYTLSFECSDGAFQYSTSTYQGPLVESNSTPSNNQGDNNFFSTNLFAITITLGITIGSVVPSIVFVEIKVRKIKSGKISSTKIKKKGIKS